MLSIVVGREALNEVTNEFVIVDAFNLQLEHSLVALSKWESIWEKPFLSTTDKTPEMMISHIECMILNPVYPKNVLNNLSEENLKEIAKYMESKQSATWFSELQAPPKSREIVTAELIYFWLDTLNIDVPSAETWHLQRLFNRIRIHSLKNAKPKKMSRSEMARQRSAINEQRRRELGTSG